MKLLPKKNFCLFLLIFFFLLLPFVNNKTKVYAEAESYWNNTIDEFNAQMSQTANAPETQLNGLAMEGFRLDAVVYNLTNKISCLSDDPEVCNPEQTALGNITLAMSTIYANPPASFAYYLHDTLAHAGLAKPAFAQGIGFAAMTPILSLWKVTRNIAYAVLILVMLVIGFMIIFRMKIDPKTVISLQAALPKIILTLVLITFSYAIVGFLIDLMYLVMAILISVISQGMGYNAAKTADQQTYFVSGGIWTLLGQYAGTTVIVIWNLLKGLWWEWGLTSGGIAGALTIIGKSALPLVGNIARFVFPFLPELLIVLIVVLGMLFSFIRMLLLLLNSYIQVLIALILGPIQLLGEAIPGKSTFGGWISNIVANLVVFPATAVIFMFATYLLNLGSIRLWRPPFIDVGQTGAFPTFLGMGVLFMAPNLIASIKKMFKPAPVIPLGLGTMLSPLTGAVQSGMGAASQFYYLDSFRKMFTKKE